MSNFVETEQPKIPVEEGQEHEYLSGDLIEELWPGVKELPENVVDKKSYSIAEWERKDVENTYADVIPKVAQSLDEAKSLDAVFNHLQQVDKLFMGDWLGKKVVKGSIYYDDSPVESGAYCYLMNKAFLPALSKLEKLSTSGSAIDRSSVITRLEEYIQKQYEFDSWYFNRASELVVSMLNINGASAFPSIEKASKYITDVKTSSYQQILSREYGEVSYDYDEDVYYNKSTYLEFADPEYRKFHSTVVKAIANYSWSEKERPIAARFLTEYLSVRSEGSLGNYVEAFENLGAENAVPYLLKNLKSNDTLTRRMSAEILFRLELGNVGVTEKGVEYLGKLYDLGKYNDPDFFVRRLNSSGLMAVLEEGSIKGVFPLNLYSKEDVIQTEVRQLMSQELFLPKADETPIQRQQRDKYLQLFLENYESIFNDKFFKGTGVKLNSLDLHEQGWFLLNYLKLSNQEDTKELERLRKFVTEYGEYGLKSFLALEYGGSGQEILDFAETSKLEKEEKLAVLKNFYCVANEALGLREIFKQTETDIGYEFAPQVYEAFVRKNTEFFKAAQIIAKGEGGDITIKELLRNMNTMAFSLKALRGIYEEDLGLRLEQRPQIQDEYDKDGVLVKSASTSFVLVDKLENRIVISIRPKSTVKKGSVLGGEARINFSVTNSKTKDNARISLDLSDYGGFIGEVGKPTVVSLDIGVGKPDRSAGIWPSQRVGRVLGLVEGSEGGHSELSFKPEVANHFSEVAEKFRGYIKSRFIM